MQRDKPKKVGSSFHVAGKIIDENGAPVIGANIIVKGEGKGTISNTTGYFNFSFNSSATQPQIVIKFIGMKEETRILKKKVSSFEIIMEEATNTLNDVVVTGYQTISKERATGAFVKIGGEELRSKPVNNISEVLTSSVPGMTSSKSGSTNRFLIRGVGTFQGASDRDPLIVLDGMPLSGIGESDDDPFASINPDDVESITVLKDASATSIYGARAGNGVIVIQTKKGAFNQNRTITTSASWGVSEIGDLDYAFHMADGKTTFKFLERLADYTTNYSVSYRNPYYSSTNPFVYLSPASSLVFEREIGNLSEEEYQNGVQKLLSKEGKWKDEYKKYVFQNALTQRYSLALNGGGNTNSYALSALYNSNKSSQIGNSSESFVLSMSQSFKLTKNLNLSFSGNLHAIKSTNQGISLSNLQSFTTPFTTLFNEDGSYAHIAKSGTIYEPILRDKYSENLPKSWEYNPLADREESKSTTDQYNTRFNIGLQYQVIDGLKISASAQYERNQYKGKDSYNEDSYYMRDLFNKYSQLDPQTGQYVSVLPAGGSYTDFNELYTSYYAKGQAEYNKEFNGKHDITFLIGGEIKSSTREVDPSYKRFGFNEKTYSIQTSPDLINKTTNIFGQKTYYPYSALGRPSIYESRSLGFYSNFAYSYDSKYTLNLSARTDAANYISDKTRNKFSPFWSAGLSWNASKEHFLKDIKGIDYLKARLTYGVTGVSAGVRSASTITTIRSYTPSVVYSNNEPYAGISMKGNPTLTWEKQKNLNLGIDFSFWNSKLYGSIELYTKYSYDVLSSASTPYITQSQSSTTFNNADISNRGIELQVSSQQKITKDFSWNGRLIYFYNKNKVEKYNLEPTWYGGSTVLGRPLSAIYAYKLTGATSEGFPILEAKDGTTIIAKDRTSTHYYDKLDPSKNETADDGLYYRYMGTAVAPHHLSFENTFKYKDFSLRFRVSGKFGHKFWLSNSYSYSTSSIYYGKGLEEAFEQEANGYAGSKVVKPMFSESNHEQLNNGSAYLYIGNLYDKSTALLRNAGFLEFEEIYLSYNLPRKFMLTHKLPIKHLSLYAKVNNIGLLWTANAEGVNPEYQWGGFKPRTTLTFGLNVKF